MTAMSGTPAYVQVAADLRSQIESGVLQPGQQIPSNSQLRSIYSVSNTVVRDAVNELRRAGLVVGQQGKGVFVRVGAAEEDDASKAETRLRDLQERVTAIEEDNADLRALIMDLYGRTGQPSPRASKGAARREQTG
jgi:DNA-binding GntR family transcriptional regulator